MPGLSADQRTYVLELMGHAKAVTALALLGPAAAGDKPGQHVRQQHPTRLGPTLALLCKGSVVVSANADGAQPFRGAIWVVHPARREPPCRAPGTRNSGAAVGRCCDPCNTTALFYTLDCFALGAGVLNRDWRKANVALEDCTTLVASRYDEAFVYFWEALIPADDHETLEKRQ